MKPLKERIAAREARNEAARKEEEARAAIHRAVLQQQAAADVETGALHEEAVKQAKVAVQAARDVRRKAAVNPFDKAPAAKTAAAKK